MIIRCKIIGCPEPARQRPAFALIELVVLIILGGTLLGLLAPFLYSAQLGAGRREGANKLRQLCLAMHNCQSVYNKLPPACDKFGPAAFPMPAHVYTLPFVEQDPAFKMLLKDAGKGEAGRLALAPFLAPDDPSNVKQDLKGVQNFAANLRAFATKGLKTSYDADMPALAEIEPGTAMIPRTFRDGRSNTILFATKFGYCGKGGSRYMAPPNAPTAAFFGQNAAQMKAHPSNKTATFQLRPPPGDCCTSPLMAQSFYELGLQVGMCDGTARQVSPNVSAHTWNAAVHPADGMPLGADW